MMTRKVIRRELKRKNSRSEKLQWAIFLSLLVVNVIYHVFFEPVYIGHNIKYTFFITVLPIVLGSPALFYYRKQYLTNWFLNENNKIVLTYGMFFFSIQGILISYLSLGLIARITFDSTSKYVADQNISETITCSVDRFWTKRSPYSINFTFNGRNERIPVNYKAVEKYANTSSESYQIQISARKGVWDYYIVDKWAVVKN